MPRSAKKDGVRLEPAFPSCFVDEDPCVTTSCGPSFYRKCHVTERDLAEIVSELRRDGIVRVDRMSPREKRIKDEHRLSLGSTP